MYFYYEQTIPVLTLEPSATVLVCKIGNGRLDFIDVGIPKGCNRLAQCRIFYNEFQLVPFNRDGWLAGNDVTLRVPIDLQISNAPYQLKMMCINLDDTFLHALSFGIALDFGTVTDINMLDALSTPIRIAGDNTP